MTKFCFAVFTYCIALSCWATADYQSHESIYQKAEAVIVSALALGIDYELEMIPLDQQLQFPRCPKPLNAFLVNKPIKPGRLSVGIQCEGEHRWSVFLSAVLKIFANVLVLTQPVSRGTTLTEELVTVERREVSRFRENYFTDFTPLRDKQTNKTLIAGTMLTLNMLSPAIIIKKGDRVMIKSANPNFAITMTGEALSDAHKGQLLRVKNLSSGRIISATAAESGVVLVN